MSFVHRKQAIELVLALVTSLIITSCATPIRQQGAELPEPVAEEKFQEQESTTADAEQADSLEMAFDIQPEPMVIAEAPEPAPVEFDAGELSAISSVDTHFWAKLEHPNTEPKGYAAYTYVLTGRTGENSEHSIRFNELVDAIRNSTQLGSSSDSTPEPLLKSRENSNVFIIPVTTNLAKEYLTTLQRAVTREYKQRLLESGPFLAVLANPLDSGQTGIENMLLADLTNIHEGAFKEIVKKLKQRLVSDDVTDIEVLQSVKTLLLSSLFILEDSLAFASVAHAEFRELFETNE